ncbi:biopolymer transporter ExbD [Flavobacterium columnare]|uniref:Biopolymer transporter ExbD n=1 Tax=Flavobacterium columnare TaxID=996 RepID=A0A437U8E1_9FLAO|nr:biopolymer transporter ExbD [Flavobacterium columnare]RVU89831.1 biopolymer transporter ExbD [Flavobacterium columnare]
MSETRHTFGRKPLTRKSKNLKPRVDLTAMVSISFLLIVFFMLTSFLSRPNAMDLGMPGERGCGGCEGGIHCYEDSSDRECTILLKEDKIILYHGHLEFPYETPKTFSYKNDDLAKELIKKNVMIQTATGDPKKGLIVLVKASRKSNYGNLVHALDALAIAKTPSYAVVDITPEEEAFLKNK